MMLQGDQYSLMIPIMSGCDPITPDMIEGVKIQVGDVVKLYPGDLEYDSKMKCWLYPLTQEQTLGMRGRVTAQVQVNFGGDPAQIIGAKPKDIFIDNSLIKKEWNEQ